MKTPFSNRLNRRDFLKYGTAAGVGAALAKSGLAGAAETLAAGRQAAGAASLIDFKVAPIDRVRIGFVGVGGMGIGHSSNLLKIEGVEITAVCDIVPDKVARVQTMVRGGRAAQARRLQRGPRISSGCASARTSTWSTPPRLGVARAGVCARHEGRQARRDRGARRLHARGLLAAGRDRRADRPSLHHDGELLLRPARDDGAEHGAARGCSARSSTPRRLHARPPRGQVQQRRRGALAAGPLAEAERQPVPDPRPRARGPVHEHQPGRPVRLPGLDEHGPRGHAAYAAENLRPPTIRAARRSTSSATSTPALIHTANGRSIILLARHQPAPAVQPDQHRPGHQGHLRGFPDQIYIEGRSKDRRVGVAGQRTARSSTTRSGRSSRSGPRAPGHGGMDFIEDYRLIDACVSGRPLDMDVYDAAAWSAVTPLSE